MQNDPDKFKKIIPSVVIVILLLWGLNFFLLFTTKESRGVFGDMFGAVNALFSGLALAGIVLTIYLQRIELSLQRDELKETRKEFSQQNFENTFFNLLKNQQEIASKIKANVSFINNSTTDVRTDVVNNQEFFIRAKKEIKRIASSLERESFHIYNYEHFYEFEPEEYIPDEENENFWLAYHSYTNYFYGITEEKWKHSKSYNKFNFCRLSYLFFFRRYHFVIGHYFRHLYHILKFIDFSETADLNETDDTEEMIQIKRKYLVYAQFVQSQMSAPELLLLYYNCLAFPKTKVLVVKYDILGNLNIEDLVNSDHNVMTEIKLKERKDLFIF